MAESLFSYVIFLGFLTLTNGDCYQACTPELASTTVQLFANEASTYYYCYNVGPACIAWKKYTVNNAQQAQIQVAARTDGYIAVGLCQNVTSSLLWRDCDVYIVGGSTNSQSYCDAWNEGEIFNPRPDTGTGVPVFTASLAELTNGIKVATITRMVEIHTTDDLNLLNRDHVRLIIGVGSQNDPQNNCQGSLLGAVLGRSNGSAVEINLTTGRLGTGSFATPSLILTSALLLASSIFVLPQN